MTRIDLRFETIDNDYGDGPGGDLLDRLEAARNARRPRARAQSIMRGLDRLVEMQHDCGGWAKTSKAPPPSHTKHRAADNGDANMHFDDDSITSIIRALHGAAELLTADRPDDANIDAAQRYTHAADRALGFCRVCFDRNRGIPGQATPYGDSVQQRAWEPGGTVDLLATFNVARTARVSGFPQLGEDCDAVLAEAKLANGRYPRVIDARNRQPVYTDAEGKTVSSAREAARHYRWELSLNA